MKLVLPVLLAAFGALSACAQQKVFAFDHAEMRDTAGRWKPSASFKPRTVCFSFDKIDLKLDRHYQLRIVSTTHLPNNGVIYICKDQRQHEVTVTLIDREKMYVYDGDRRYLVPFAHHPLSPSVEKSYADAD
jgi:hypothetical protein